MQALPLQFILVPESIASFATSRTSFWSNAHEGYMYECLGPFHRQGQASWRPEDI